MTFHIVTLFPELFNGFLSESIVKRAIERGTITVKLYNPRDFTTDKHHKADDRPFGDGPGMVMYAEPILRAVESITTQNSQIAKHCYVMSPRGKKFSNSFAEGLKKNGNDVIIICGRYEGIDARVKKILGAQEVSIGPYTLSGGEVPAMVIIDAVARRLDGVLGNSTSIEEERTAARYVYTRPELLEWKGKKYKVPKILLSGHHKNLEKWREKH